MKKYKSNVLNAPHASTEGLSNSKESSVSTPSSQLRRSTDSRQPECSSDGMSPSSSDVQELVARFNSQVGNRGWCSARAVHDRALISQLISKGVDVSAVYDGHSISFAHHVVLDEGSMKLLVIE